MRIGHFVPVVSRLNGWERNVSGHVQIPLRTIQLLGERGHEVHLITNEFGGDRVLPWCMPENAQVHYVIDSRRRLGSLEKKRSPVKGVYPLAFLRQIRQIKRIARERKLDIFHVHGHERTVQFAGVLRMAGLGIPTIATAVAQMTGGSFGRGFAIRRAGPIITATEFVANSIRPYRAEVHVMRHGLVRDFRDELDWAEPRPKHRVLYWRDLTWKQGADVAVAAFDALAPEFPDVSFDFAVRPQRVEVAEAEELARKHPNVHLHRFPYPPGVSLAGLVAESICALMPFRSFTIQPQLSICETLAMGVPVIVSDIQSAREVVMDGETGRLVPMGDAVAATHALRDLLTNRERAAEMGRRAAEDIASRWNWDGYVEGLTALYERLLNRAARRAIAAPPSRV